jgi:hypothetical protein
MRIAARGSPRRVTARLYMAVSPLMIACFVSAQALLFAGVNYTLGAIPEKIHPATYIAMLCVAAQLCARRDSAPMRIVRDYPGPMLLALSATLLAIYVGLALDAPATGLVDTWVLTACVFLLFAALNEREVGVARIAVDVFFAINSVVAIVEVATNTRLVPVGAADVLGGVYAYPYEWRASAFLGHSLNGSYLTGAYVLLLILDRRIRPLALRLPLLCLHALALLDYGSRAAAAFAAITLVLMLIVEVIKAVSTGKIRKDSLVTIGSVIALSAFGAPLMIASGFLDRFIGRLSADHGSASARFHALDMLASFSWSDLLLGPPRALLEQLQARYSVGAGIESFWLGYLFSYGLVGCAIFFPSLLLYCRDLVRRVGPHALVVLIYFFACCSTSVSLSSKSIALAILTGMLMTSRRLAVVGPPRARRVRPPSRSASEAAPRRAVAATSSSPPPFIRTGAAPEIARGF